MNAMLAIRARLQRQASENQWTLTTAECFLIFFPLCCFEVSGIYVSSNLQTIITLPQMHLIMPCIIYLFIPHKSIPLAIWKTRTTFTAFQAPSNLFSKCYRSKYKMWYFTYQHISSILHFCWYCLYQENPC